MYFKERLSTDDLLRGVANVIPSAVATQAVASAGLDFVMIDREHGPVGRENLHAMVASTAGTDCAPLVRVPAIDEGEVKVALDAGAEGIVYPLVRTRRDAERCVSLVNYPPSGLRGWGPFVAHSRHKTPLFDYLGAVGPQMTCCLLIETAEAVEHIEAILDVPGVDLAVMAQFDLSTALGVHGQFDAPVFVDAIAAIEQAAAAKGVPLGGVAMTAEQSASLIANGYRVLLHGFDVLMLKSQVAGFMTWT